MKIVRVQKCVLRSSFRQIRGQNWNGSHYYNQSHFLKAKFNYRINGGILINTLNEFTLSLFYVTGEFLCSTYKVQKYKRDCYIAIFAFSFYTHHTLFIVWSVTFPEFPMKRGAVLRPPICGFFFLSEIIMIDEIWNNSSRSEPDEPSTAWLCKLFCHPRVFGNNRTIVLYRDQHFGTRE